MTRLTALLLTAVVIATVPAPRASAGIDLGLGLFKKKPKADATSKVKQIVATLQSDPDEKKRRTAAEDARDIDPRANPDLLPALAASLQNDPSPAVRSEAAESIGKLKPVDQPSGLALEAALGADPSDIVREAVKDALWQYHLNGYKSPAADKQFPAQTAEPPFA
ncbi:MAG: HEAT repeat domain-containing protein, partial [Fimbriiglobus sp.]